MLELLAEPFYIISSTRLEFGRRASIDTAAMITKCVVTLALVMRTALAPALVFAAAQLAFAGVVLLGYLRYGLMLWQQVIVFVWVEGCVCVWGGGDVARMGLHGCMHRG
jgi:hypothetical protein